MAQHFKQYLSTSPQHGWALTSWVFQLEVVRRVPLLLSDGLWFPSNEEEPVYKQVARQSSPGPLVSTGEASGAQPCPAHLHSVGLAQYQSHGGQVISPAFCFSCEGLMRSRPLGYSLVYTEVLGGKR